MTEVFPETYKHFRRVSVMQKVSSVPVVEYVSDFSQCRILLSNVQRPLVDGIILIPTEVHHQRKIISFEKALDFSKQILSRP